MPSTRPSPRQLRESRSTPTRAGGAARDGSEERRVVMLSSNTNERTLSRLPSFSLQTRSLPRARHPPAVHISFLLSELLVSNYLVCQFFWLAVGHRTGSSNSAPFLFLSPPAYKLSLNFMQKSCLRLRPHPGNLSLLQGVARVAGEHGLLDHAC